MFLVVSGIPGISDGAGEDQRETDAENEKHRVEYAEEEPEEITEEEYAAAVGRGDWETPLGDLLPKL